MIWETENVFELYVLAYIYNLNTHFNKYLLFADKTDEDDEILYSICKYLKLPQDKMVDAILGLVNKGLIVATKENGRTYYSVREDLL